MEGPYDSTGLALVPLPRTRPASYLSVGHTQEYVLVISLDFPGKHYKDGGAGLINSCVTKEETEAQGRESFAPSLLAGED